MFQWFQWFRKVVSKVRPMTTTTIFFLFLSNFIFSFFIFMNISIKSKLYTYFVDVFQFFFQFTSFFLLLPNSSILIKKKLYSQSFYSNCFILFLILFFYRPFLTNFNFTLFSLSIYDDDFSN